MGREIDAGAPQQDVAAEGADAESGDSQVASADRFDTSINDDRTADILKTFSTTAVEQKAALSPEQRKQLEGLENSFATGNVEEMSKLVKELNAGDRGEADKVLQTFRSDLFALGISNSVSGNEGMGWSLNLFRNAPDGSRQIMSIDPNGRRSTRTYNSDNGFNSTGDPGSPGNSSSLPEMGDPFKETAVPSPQEFLRGLRQGRSASQPGTQPETQPAPRRARA